MGKKQYLFSKIPKTCIEHPEGSSTEIREERRYDDDWTYLSVSSFQIVTENLDTARTGEPASGYHDRQL